MALRRSILITSLLVLGRAAAQQPPDSSRSPMDTGRAVPPPLTSQTVITGDMLNRLPIDDPRQALMLAPGVVLRGGEIGIASTPRLSIRGSPAGETSVYVDGAPVRFETFGTQGVSLGTLGIDAVAVTTGVADATVADARGGVLSYITRSGGAKLAGSWRTETDEPFGDGSTVGYNRFEGDVGGPLPGVPHLTWFLSGTLQGQRSHYYGRGAADQPAYVVGSLDTLVQWTDGSGSTFAVPVPQYVQWSGSCSASRNYGYDCQGLRRPMDWSTARRGQAKLVYGYGVGSSLSLTGITSDLAQRAFPAMDFGDPSLYGGSRIWSRLAVANWSHALGGAGARPLTLGVTLSYGTDRQIAGPLTTASELDTRDPGLGIEFSTLDFTGLDSIPFPLPEGIVRNIRSNTGLRVPFLSPGNGNGQDYRLNPYAMAFGWPTRGLGARLITAWERRWNGQASLAWQADPRNRVSAGADFTTTDLAFYDTELITMIGLDAFRAQPRRYGAFASDRITLGSLLLDLGVRYDHFTPGGDFPRTPGFVSLDPNWNPDAATNDTAYANSVARVFQPARGQGIVSPRLRAAYAVSARTSVRAAYGQQVEPPSFDVLFTNTNSDLTFTPTAAPFGRDVGYAKRVLIELGARHELASGLAFDLSLYHARHPAPFTFRILPFVNPRQASDTLDISVLTKLDGGHGTGCDARLDWRHGDIFSASISYSFLRAHSSDQAAGVTTQSLYAVLDLSVPRYWQGDTPLGAIARDIRALATLRVTTGLPYTRLFNNGDGQVVPRTGAGIDGLVAERPDASQLPTTKTLDLRLTKSLRMGGRELRAYADVRNLFNFTNVLGLYAETGGVTNDKFKQLMLSPEYTNLASEASAAGALNPDGSINLSGNCNSWGSPPDCVALRRVEARFGNGDLLYTPAEQTRALDTYYNSFFGPWRFYGPSRTVRVGLEVGF